MGGWLSGGRWGAIRSRKRGLPTFELQFTTLLDCNNVQVPLIATARTAGELLSSSTFEIPPFQRDYSWELDEVTEFWSDLKNAIQDQTYFLGLVILTEQKDKKHKHVIDGQQRLLTLTLLATALYYEAFNRDRKALAERVKADLLRSIDYTTDDTHPRVFLADPADNETLQFILNTGETPTTQTTDPDSISKRLIEAFKLLRQKLRDDLKDDPFKRLGAWADFLTNNLYFAAFIHPDDASAYKVFEVVNTRGRELTTADLLKNYVLSQTPSNQRDDRYKQWRYISKQFSSYGGASSFVQYIRHVELRFKTATFSQKIFLIF